MIRAWTSANSSQEIQPRTRLGQWQLGFIIARDLSDCMICEVHTLHDLWNCLGMIYKVFSVICETLYTGVKYFLDLWNILCWYYLWSIVLDLNIVSAWSIKYSPWSVRHCIGSVKHYIRMICEAFPSSVKHCLVRICAVLSARSVKHCLGIIYLVLFVVFETLPRHNLWSIVRDLWNIASA